jgi:pilus assembly protein Flp/PilA
MKRFKQIMVSERGQGMAEYGLIIALIAVVCIAAVAFIGKGVNKNFEEVGEALGG